ncbi:MAG: GTP 3',8-cyclase MoaA [Candidatus Latescibacteria bacterium]|jgi:cyclic pyranopterin phosphate synthase|nr:GTP 3',8-cyclase MoaA [Candidatus Latescibacterota bacterium]
MSPELSDTLSRSLQDLRISVTDRCNFRCPYCMPAEILGERYSFLPKSEILSFEEITRLVRIFVRLGVRKIRLTGGEPLLRQNIEALVSALAGLDDLDDLALTTNGYLLPEKAAMLREAGLKRITVSLDSLDEEAYRQLNGRDHGPEQVLEAIREAERVGFHPIKINAVVQKGVNDHTIVDLARYFHGTGHVLRFIEFMDVGNQNRWDLSQVTPAEEILDTVNAAIPLEPLPSNYPGEVATRFRYLDGGGEIGVIASVTRPFCGGCTRIRISTDGKAYTCLFGSEGTDLRGPLRDGANDRQLTETVSGLWMQRADRYSELRAEGTSGLGGPPKIEMYRIGG